ncbi:hypothetical protein ACIPF8_12310 [Collimonas sp. NPDC087041]|uniref:hypothetical protein n=1 Tax=Collimonas sp. NPDC087041 TaxID=3363960 RepID=UPI003830994C
MISLFLIFILLSLFEGLLQFLWAPFYFTHGLPLLKINGSGQLSIISDNNKYKLHQINTRFFLLRQRNFLGRTAFHHGFITIKEHDSSSELTCSLYLDWNVLLAGGFLSCALLGVGISQYFFGAALAYLLARLMLNFNLDAIKKITGK